MPTGFAELPTPSDENLTRLGGGTLNSTTIPFPTFGRLARGFQQGTDPLVPGPGVGHTVVLLQNPKDAPKALRAFRDASAAAATWEQELTQPLGTITFTASALSFPKIGDETLALRLTRKFRDARSGFESDQPPVDFVLWRHGAILSFIGVGGTDTLSQVKKADAKLSKTLVRCTKTKDKKTTPSS